MLLRSMDRVCQKDGPARLNAQDVEEAKVKRQRLAWIDRGICSSAPIATALKLKLSVPGIKNRQKANVPSVTARQARGSHRVRAACHQRG